MDEYNTVFITTQFIQTGTYSFTPSFEKVIGVTLDMDSALELLTDYMIERWDWKDRPDILKRLRAELKRVKKLDHVMTHSDPMQYMVRGWNIESIDVRVLEVKIYRQTTSEGSE